MALEMETSTVIDDYYNTSDVASNGDEETMMIPDEEVYMKQPLVKAIFIGCYAFLFCVGVVSNSIMMLVGLRNWRGASAKIALKNGSARNSMNNTVAVTNLLVANLAAGDIVLCLFSTPSTPFSYYFPNWPLGDFACRFLPSTLITAVCVISFTSTVLAVDRHLAICYPSEKRLTIRWAFASIALIWLLSIACSVPVFLSRSVVIYEEEDYAQCLENWPSHAWQKAFSIFSLAMQFALPFVVIFYCYSAIFFVIRSQDRFRSKIAAQTSYPSLAVTFSGSLARLPSSTESCCGDISRAAQKQRSSSSNVKDTIVDGCFGGKCSFVSLMFDARFMRTTRILVSMVSIFMTCWFPINLLQIVQDYLVESDLWGTTRWYSLAWFSAHVVAMSSTLWNPLLYGWLNENFRSEIVRILSFSRVDLANKTENGSLIKVANSKRNISLKQNSDGNFAVIAFDSQVDSKVSSSGVETTNSFDSPQTTETTMDKNQKIVVKLVDFIDNNDRHRKRSSDDDDDEGLGDENATEYHIEEALIKDSSRSNNDFLSTSSGEHSAAVRTFTA